MRQAPQRTQNDQVKALIDEGSNVLCINLVDRADPSEIIDLARENDVPVIFFNREPVAEDMMQWEKLYYVGADAKQSGVMQGELAAELIHRTAGWTATGTGRFSMWCWKESRGIRIPLSGRKMRWIR